MVKVNQEYGSVNNVKTESYIWPFRQECYRKRLKCSFKAMLSLERQRKQIGDIKRFISVPSIKIEPDIYRIRHLYKKIRRFIRKRKIQSRALFSYNRNTRSISMKEIKQERLCRVQSHDRCAYYARDQFTL